MTQDLYIDTLGRLWDREADQEVDGVCGSLFAIYMDRYIKDGAQHCRLAIDPNDASFTYLPDPL